MKKVLVLGLGLLCGIAGLSERSVAASVAGDSMLEEFMRGDATAEALCRSHCNLAHASCLLEVATMLREAQDQLARCLEQANSNRTHDERECNTRHSQNPPELRRCLERAAEDHRSATASCNTTFDNKKQDADKKADKCNTDQDSCIADCKRNSGTPRPKSESAFTANEAEIMQRDFVAEQLEFLNPLVSE